MAYVTVRIKGVEGHTLVAIEKERVILGRASTNDIQLSAEAVSRQHCCIYRFDGSWFVEDMGSANGTRVAGEKITKPCPLEERSVIKCGHARMTFHTGAMPTRRSNPDDAGTERHERIASYQMRPGDPADAFRCETCGTWINCSHHIQGDHMACPRCNANLQVPTLLPPAMPVAADAGEDAAQAVPDEA